jgi:lipoprotein NlpI
VYLVRGNAYLEQNEFELAINDFDGSLRLSRRDPQVYLARGRALAGRGSYDHAFADFSQAIKLSPKLYRAYFERGSPQIWRREFDAAIADYTIAIKNIPALSQAFGNRGWARILKGQFRQAAADFEAEIQARGRPMAWLWRYLAVARAGEVAKAALDLAAGAFEPGQWPWPIVQLFRGELTAEAAVQASRHSDLAVEERQRCEAFFYNAERRLIANDRAGATTDFQKAKAICPAQSLELVVAWAEFDAIAAASESDPQ